MMGRVLQPRPNWCANNHGHSNGQILANGPMLNPCVEPLIYRIRLAVRVLNWHDRLQTGLGHQIHCTTVNVNTLRVGKRGPCASCNATVPTVNYGKRCHAAVAVAIHNTRKDCYPTLAAQLGIAANDTHNTTARTVPYA